MSYQLLRVGEVSKIIGCGQSTIWRWVKDKTFPAPIKIGGSSRWREDQVFDFIGSLNPSQASRNVVTSFDPRTAKRRLVRKKPRQSDEKLSAKRIEPSPLLQAGSKNSGRGKRKNITN